MPTGHLHARTLYDRFVGHVGPQAMFFAIGNGIVAVLISAGLCLYAHLAGWPVPGLWVIPLSGILVLAITLLFAAIVNFVFGFIP